MGQGSSRIPESKALGYGSSHVPIALLGAKTHKREAEPAAGMSLSQSLGLLVSSFVRATAAILVRLCVMGSDGATGNVAASARYRCSPAAGLQLTGLGAVPITSAVVSSRMKIEVIWGAWHAPNETD